MSLKCLKIHSFFQSFILNKCRLKDSLNLVSSRNNSFWCTIPKPRRTFVKMYETDLFLEDGSSISIRQKQPLAYLQFPTDISNMGEKQRRALWVERKEASFSVEDEDLFEETFDSSQYQKFFK